MPRIALLLAALSCGGSGDSDTDTDEADTDEAADELICDYPGLVGSWSADKYTEGATEYALAITGEFYPAVAKDERVGLMSYIGTPNGQTLECYTELICVGRDQNDWRVAMVRPLPGSVGAECVSLWAFLKLDQQGGLRKEFAETEFGQHYAFTDLTRVD